MGWTGDVDVYGPRSTYHVTYSMLLRMAQTVYRFTVVDTVQQPEPYIFHLRIKDGADILRCAYQALQMHMDGECERLDVSVWFDAHDEVSSIKSSNQVLSSYQRFVVTGVAMAKSVL